MMVLLSFAVVFVFSSYANQKIKKKDLPKQLVESIERLSLGVELQSEWRDVPLGALGDRVPPEWLDGPEKPIDALGQNSIIDVIQLERERDTDLFRDYLKYVPSFDCDKTDTSILIEKKKLPSKSYEIKLSTLGSVSVEVESFISAKKIQRTLYQLFDNEQYENFINRRLDLYGKWISLGIFPPTDPRLDAYLKKYTVSPYFKDKGLPLLPALRNKNGSTLNKIEQSAQLEFISVYKCNERYLKTEKKIMYQITHELQTNNIQKLLNQKLKGTVREAPAKQCVGETTNKYYRNFEIGIANGLIKNKPYPSIEQYFAADMSTNSLKATASVNYYQCNKNDRNVCKACPVGTCCTKISRYYGERKLVKSKKIDMSLDILKVDGILTSSINLGGDTQTIKLQEASTEQALKSYVHPSFKLIRSKVMMPDNIQSVETFEMQDSVTPSVATLLEFAIEAL